MAAILEARGISKDFPGVRALDNVSFILEESQIHALCGENGAGKSTFINVLSGYFPSSSHAGQILVGGQVKTFSTIREAEEAGIAVIHQELNLFPELSAAENIFMGHEIARGGILDWNEMYSQTGEWIRRLKLGDVRPRTKVKDLGIGKQQLIEIARVLRLPHMKILILDEPTASLTDSETELSWISSASFRRDGIACIYISHKIEEVLEIADRVTVLRDGRTVGGGDIGDAQPQGHRADDGGPRDHRVLPKGTPRRHERVRPGGEGLPPGRPSHGQGRSCATPRSACTAARSWACSASSEPAARS